jgi:signal transduction histidine kinase
MTVEQREDVRDVRDSTAAGEGAAAYDERRGVTVSALRDLLDRDPEALLVVGADGRVEVGNRSAEELWGGPGRQLLGREVRDLLRPRAEADPAEQPEVAEILATVGHELRTPLTAVLGFAEWALDDWEAASDEEKRAWLRRILDAAVRLDRLLTDLVEYSRTERGELRLELAPVPVAELVREAVEHAELALDGHPLVIRVREDLRVHADRVTLGRVMENLLSNAGKFSPLGAVVAVSAATEGDRILITVRDQGVGIDEDEQDRVFDRFYRSPATASQQGTGIGLAIVRRFVEAQGGQVALVSQPGEGSAFTISLPAG